MFKIETVQQFKILKFLKENFDMHFIDIFILSTNTILIHDQKGDSAIFSLNEENGEMDDNKKLPLMLRKLRTLHFNISRIVLRNHKLLTI